MLRKGVVLFSDNRCETGCRCNNHIPALEHVANRPIAYHVLDAMLAAGTDQLVIAGPADVLIDVRACLSRYGSEPVCLDYAVCDKGAHPIGVFRAAARLVGAAPCIVHAGEGLLDHPIAPYVESLQDRSLDLVLLCQRLSSSRGPRSSATDDAAVPIVRSSAWDAGIGVFGPGAFRDAVQCDPETGPSG